MIATLPASLWAAIPVAVAAGFVSFASPCILPLVPGYMAFLGGAMGQATSGRHRGRALVGAMAFIVGFSVVFVSLGALFGEFGAHLKAHQRPLSIVFGVVTILLGLFFAGWMPSRMLERERRSHRLPSATALGALLLGFLFALGWSPCVGPTLEGIEGLAASTSNASALRGSLLALFYCAGLGIPFILFAVASEFATSTSRWLRKHQHAVGICGGVLLIAIGVLEVTGWWQSFVIWLQVHFPGTTSPI